jgi:hypothetical protein
MDVALLHKLYDAFAGDRSTFLYSGRFHDAHTARLIVLGEESSSDHENGKGLRARLAFVLVEAYQNIIRHRAKLPTALARGPGRSLLLVRAFEGTHEVSTMNPVSNSEAVHVVRQLSGLEQLVPQQLKERYLESLKHDSRTERGGAGLGLIEMARRSGNALRHHLTPIDEAHQLFTLQVVLEPVDNSPQSWILLEMIHHEVVASDLVLFCKGISSQRMAEALERMVEQELADEPRFARSASLALRTMLALLDHLAAEPSDLSLSLTRTPSGYSLIAGTLLDRPNTDRLQAAFADPIKTAEALASKVPIELVQQLERFAEQPFAFERMASQNGLYLAMITIPL